MHRSLEANLRYLQCPKNRISRVSVVGIEGPPLSYGHPGRLAPGSTAIAPRTEQGPKTETAP